MKRRSISGFITGLLGVIATGFIAFIGYIIFGIVFGIAETEDVIVENGMLIKISFALYAISLILGIIAICFYFRKARVGGILMLISAFTNAGFPLSFINYAKFELSYLWLFIPTFLFLLSAILGLCSKARSVIAAETETNNQVPPPINQIKYCPKCGSSMRINDDFCPFCGTKQ